MKTASPLGQGGTSGGFLNVGTNPAPRSATAGAVVRSVADEHRTPTTPAVAVGHCIPSSTEEGSLFSTELFMAQSDKKVDVSVEERSLHLFKSERNEDLVAIGLAALLVLAVLLGVRV